MGAAAAGVQTWPGRHSLRCFQNRMPFTEEWSMYINHNGMATNVANTLTSHYSNLSTSTERLSSGMRINSAADDAAGLAISELMRADIAALNQGVRNANDAISLIQTADGALGVIDEKLIRMKELAEQASTGTYDSTQRLMIDSEYQQMASEITRIANATDFNGIKLLDGTLSGVHNGSQATATGALKVHFGTSNDSAEDYYYIEIGEATAQAFGLGNASNFEDDKTRMVNEFRANLEENMKHWNRGDQAHRDAYAEIDTLVQNFSNALDSIDTSMAALATAWGNLTEEQQQFYGKGLPQAFPPDQATFDAMSDSDKQKVQYAYARAVVDSWATDPANGFGGINLTVPANATAADGGAAVEKALGDMATALHTKYDYGGQSIATQEDAQLALDAINNAIVEKDKIRAHLGATQNRLENTVTNLTIQSENLQNAESRIRDVDVATEMTNFVRNQVLTQSAVAMLSQANSMPQMAMQLIG